ncbi:MAG: CvpA family protein [Oscillospiraceae bacterium]|nr:CvpA family protein [Oscillospiraceae bacterium]
MTAFLLDFAIVGTIAFCAWRGYKNGLIRGVFGVVSLIASLLVANMAAEAYSGEAKGMLMPFVGGMLDSTITDLSDEGVEYHAIAHDHDIDDIDFGTAYLALRQIGFPEAASVKIAELSIESDEDEPGRYFSDVIADRVSSVLSYVAVFGIAFLLIAIIFAVIGNLVGFVFALPGLRLVDIISGSVLGLFKGIILVYSVAVVVRYFGLLILSTLESTSILLYLVNNNPIANLLGV